ncbi:MAG: hypothetical protein KTR35_18030 [Gammaproteobacteria bacterium]|nr:hypothetical protein [Gammaproteobacteria bacterium]
MHYGTLALKDIREHGLALLSMAVSICFAVYLLLKSAQLGAFSISTLEAVRKSLIMLFPLITFILGNRLIVREYLGKTRLFVEALPTKRYKPLLQKYVLGLFYLALVALMVVSISTFTSSFVDNIDTRRFLLILTKTLTIVLLYWSVVFCFSFCGFIRTLLYLLLFGAVFLVNGLPNFDETTIGPFALLDAQLFTYEREHFPWQDILETLGLAALFSIIGFAIALYNEGSLTEALAKPLSRRDFVATGILGFTLFVLLSSLYENFDKEPYNFGNNSVRHDDVPVSVFYIDQSYQSEGVRLLDAIALAAQHLKDDFNIKRLPEIRLALDDTLEPHDLALDDIDGILITANYVGYDDYQVGVLQAAVYHQYFTAVSGQRIYFEPYHWLLDGVARWWAVHQVQQTGEEQKNEILSRAVFASRLFETPDELDMANNWQWLADKAGYPSAEALAYSAIRYLVETYDQDTLATLTNRMLWNNYRSNSLESFSEYRFPFESRFEEVTSITWVDFQTGWLAWLEEQAKTPKINELLLQVPYFATDINVELDSNNQRWITANYTQTNEQNFEGGCVLRHTGMSPFDAEYVSLIEEGDEIACDQGENTHTVSSWYPEGARLYILLEHNSPLFHEPLRLNAVRLTSP